MKDDNVYLHQIIECVSKIEDFVAGFDRQKFYVDPKTQSAVIMQLLLIGETAKKLSAKTKSLIDLPWKDIAGFRDRAIHNYFDIDLDIVWDTIASDLPTLSNKIRPFLRPKLS